MAGHREHLRRGGGEDSGQRYRQAAAPGKRSRSDHAYEGVEGAGGALPHLEAIQRSFGAHDISDVRAHDGEAARGANAILGSNAFAFGDDVAFSVAPDLFTAAHEAAHVVQQRAGVSLAGGEGATGDAYERQADAVAEKVVRGESAVPLLDAITGGRRGARGTAAPAIQRRDEPAGQGRLPRFAEVHYHAMPHLLRLLEGLAPFSVDDFLQGGEHFGPRLVTAMGVVQNKAIGRNALNALPEDQQRDIKSYLRASGKLPSGEMGFAEAWGAHPHNYQPYPDANTSDDEVREEHELPEAFHNTCACRMSVMLNGTGHAITPATAAAAGIARRPYYSKKTKQYYIISALEMWQYVSRHFRGPDAAYPADGGTFRTKEEYISVFHAEISPLVAARSGVVAFESIFGYGGTGHMDLFDHGQLSDSNSWYPCRRLRLWFIA